MTPRPEGWLPEPGTRVRYAYNVTFEEPDVDGTVLEVRHGPGIDAFQRLVISVRVDWDASERTIPEWVVLGRLNPLTVAP